MASKPPVFKMKLKNGTRFDEYDQPDSLMLSVMGMLREYNVFEVFEATGIPYFWLNSFANGRIQNPSVNRVQYLYEYLTKTRLVTDYQVLKKAVVLE
jgi:hypothetical protein